MISDTRAAGQDDGNKDCQCPTLHSLLHTMCFLKYAENAGMQGSMTWQHKAIWWICPTGTGREGNPIVRAGLLEESRSRPHQRGCSAERACYCCCLHKSEGFRLHLCKRSR